MDYLKNLLSKTALELNTVSTRQKLKVLNIDDIGTGLDETGISTRRELRRAIEAELIREEWLKSQMDENLLQRKVLDILNEKLLNRVNLNVKSETNPPIGLDSENVDNNDIYKEIDNIKSQIGQLYNTRNLQDSFQNILQLNLIAQKSLNAVSQGNGNLEDEEIALKIERRDHLQRQWLMAQMELDSLEAELQEYQSDNRSILVNERKIINSMSSEQDSSGKLNSEINDLIELNKKLVRLFLRLLVANGVSWGTDTKYSSLVSRLGAIDEGIDFVE